jgi:type IV secretory pathway VirB2 component (pilin)
MEIMPRGVRNLFRAAILCAIILLPHAFVLAQAQAPAAAAQQFCTKQEGGTIKTGGGCYASAEECKTTLCALGAAADCACVCRATDNKECPPKPVAGGTFEPIKLINPLGAGDPDVTQLAARVIQMITGITGSIALLMFVWGGFLWTTSAGNDEKVKKAKQIFTQSVLGLVIIFGAYAILTTILRTFTGAAS